MLRNALLVMAIATAATMAATADPIRAADRGRAVRDPLATTAAWTADGEQDYASFAWSVASAGDVNGDGYDDVIVGANTYDNIESNSGRAFVFHGSAVGLSSVEDWSDTQDHANWWFGYSVASAGDVDGDGYDEVIVGAPYATPIEILEGIVYLYSGSSAGLSSAPTWSARGGELGATAGWSVASAGDVNGDGYDDVIVGVPSYGDPNTGRAVVYHGSPDGLPDDHDWSVVGAVDSSFGWSVAGAGDVDGDGFDDVVVGAPDDTLGLGGAFLYLGSAGGLSTLPAWSDYGDSNAANFGAAVGTAGDVNGDGRADVIVGAPEHSQTRAGEGRASVYHGIATGLGAVAAWTVDGGETSVDLGTSVGTAGDVDGDGYDDIIVGVPNFHDPEAVEGRALVFRGSPGGVAGDAIWTIQPDQIGAFLGRSVATAGDVDGDGYDDVIVGAPWYDDLLMDEGRASVYRGALSVSGSGSVPSESQMTAQPLLVGKVDGGGGGGDLELSWSASCAATDANYAVYEGALGNYASHQPDLCSTAGETTAVVAPQGGDRYFLVVAHDDTDEGSYGLRGDGTERGQGLAACRGQYVVACQ